MNALEKIRAEYQKNHCQIPVIIKPVDYTNYPSPENKPQEKTLIKKEQSSLYLMYNQRNKFVKIGRSKNPVRREKTLQGEDPQTILIYVWVGMGFLEKIVHKEFHSKRVRGEWFNLDNHDSLMLLKFISEKTYGL